MDKSIYLMDIDSGITNKCHHLTSRIRQLEKTNEENAYNTLFNIKSLVETIEEAIIQVRKKGVNQKQLSSKKIRQALSKVNERTYRNYLSIVKNWDWLMNENQHKPTGIKHAIMLINGMENHSKKKAAIETNNGIKSELMLQIQDLKETVKEQSEIIEKLKEELKQFKKSLEIF